MLLVDIGNSRIKWGRWSSRQVQLQGSVNWQAAALEGLFEQAWGNTPGPGRIMVANVAGPAIADRLSSWMRKQWAVVPEFVSVKARAFGVQIAYEDPKQLGVDRWLCLIAAWNRYKAPACIADCGTAMTLDALSSHGEHLGGLILPGLSLMRQVLVKHTHGIRVSTAGQRLLLACNTQDGITAGSLYAVAACIDRVASELRERFGETLRCVITGGDAEMILTLLTHPFEPIPDLVLQGLAVVAGVAE
jgi:type III pantothenate kinase